MPPRKFCERCFRPTDRWEEVAATGVVETFSICHVSWDMQPVDPPELPAVIRLDGASQGGFLHKLGEVAPDDVAIGMAVEAVWRPLEERIGLDPGHRVLPTGRGRWCLMARTVSGGMPVAFHYTPGVGNTAFFEALRDRGVLLGSRCEACAYTYLPARIFCERCFAELTADTECGPGGTLESFTVGHVGIDGEPLDEPATIGLVRLDNADTVLMHRLVGDGPWQIGGRVDAVVRAERTGSIVDIEGFRSA